MTTQEFQVIKQHILTKGDRRTYCNMYNHNPHLAIDTYHVYLTPSTGQHNMNCDPMKSDFNTLVFQDFSSRMVYYRVRLDDNQQTLSFDPPESKTYFDQLYDFVCKTN